MSTYDLVQQVFDNAMNAASSYGGQAQSKLNSAYAISGDSAPQITPTLFNFDPTVIEPAVDIPTTAEAAGFEAFRSVWAETIADLSQRFTQFIQAYFPDETNYINDAQIWISNSIQNGGTGINQEIEEQIWQRDRARVIRDAERTKEAQINSWASRGFPLPPGAAVYATYKAELDAHNSIADNSSKVAIAQAELEQKNTQFAIENAIKLWNGAMAAACDYIKAIATGPNAAGHVIPSVTDSQAKLISAAADYYKARIAVQELRLKAGLEPARWYQEANLKNGDLKMEFIKAKVQAATEGARVAGTMAAAALNALHASAALTGGYHINFQYHGETNSPADPA